jgi:hypothetical protein
MPLRRNLLGPRAAARFGETRSLRVVLLGAKAYLT